MYVFCKFVNMFMTILIPYIHIRELCIIYSTYLVLYFIDLYIKRI